MYLLTLKTRRDDGAYAVQDKHGDKVLFLFEEEDDAERYGLMLEEDGHSNMEVIEAVSYTHLTLPTISSV